MPATTHDVQANRSVRVDVWMVNLRCDWAAWTGSRERDGTGGDPPAYDESPWLVTCRHHLGRETKNFNWLLSSQVRRRDGFFAWKIRMQVGYFRGEKLDVQSPWSSLAIGTCYRPDSRYMKRSRSVNSYKTVVTLSKGQGGNPYQPY